MTMLAASFLTLWLAAADGPADKPATPAATIEQETLVRLLDVRRVFVDRLVGGETAAQLRDTIISSLQGAKLFVITENEERADTFLRGSGEDLVFTESHSSSDSLNARASAGIGSNPDQSAADRRSRAQAEAPFQSLDLKPKALDRWMKSSRALQ